MTTTQPSTQKKYNASKVVRRLWLAVALVAVAALGGLAGAGIMYKFFPKTTPTNTNTTNTTVVKEERIVSEDESVVGVVAKARPAVVSIVRGHQAGSQTEIDFRAEEAAGTGFFVSDNGLIMTNRHVVGDASATLTVLTNDGKKLPATVKAIDPLFDIAIIQAEVTGVPFLKFGASDGLHIGQHAIAIGNALGQFNNTVTVGVISGLDRSITALNGATGQLERLENAIQTDAAINPGNSGGPLVDLSGNVIGMLTAVSPSGEQLGFAIPASVVQNGLASFQQHGSIARAYLGVRYQTLTPEFAQLNNLPVSTGALVTGGSDGHFFAIVPGSPADKAGLKENDIITKIGDQTVDDKKSLSSLLLKYRPNDRVDFTIIRESKEQVVSVTLGDAEKR